MNFRSFSTLSVESCQFKSDKLEKFLHENQEKKQVVLNQILSVRNFLVSLLSQTDSEPLKEELQKTIDIIYEISREV